MPASAASDKAGWARRWRSVLLHADGLGAALCALASEGRGRASAKDNPAMHPNALLEHATELLHRVLQLKHPADSVVSDYFRAHRTLGSRERHTLAETTYAVLRKRLLWQHLAQSGQGRARAAPGGAGLAGQRRLPARRAQRDRAAMAGAGPRRRPRRRCPSGCATTCRSGSPIACSRRSATSSGRSSRRSRTRRRSTCGSTR